MNKVTYLRNSISSTETDIARYGLLLIDYQSYVLESIRNAR